MANHLCFSVSLKALCWDCLNDMANIRWRSKMVLQQEMTGGLWESSMTENMCAQPAFSPSRTYTRCKQFVLPLTGMNTICHPPAN